MDDEETLRSAAVQTLRKCGYEADSAPDGLAAIELFEAARSAGSGFDCVVLDLTVPGGMGGKDAAARLRAIDVTVPLIVSSGYSSNPVMSEFRKYGFNDVLEKPWSVAQLLQAVHRQTVHQTARVRARMAGA
jgi:two-component system, cell cycle sensor histidine kinase and response regulator CckA